MQHSNQFDQRIFFDFARQADASCRLRIAPTPSGYLHLGNAVNFTLNWLIARLNGGSILLRIDDLDGERKRPEYVGDIFDSLHWLGLDWDEGPGLNPFIDAATDFEDHWSQHHRLPLYFKHLEQLRAQHLLFSCRKSRSELAAFSGQYPPGFRQQNLSLDDPDVAWRIITPPDSGLNDFVVRRRDGIPAYQLASLTDDIHFRITHVIRGADLAFSTAAQWFLAERLHEDKFLQTNFLHHPLILGSDGEKLSKSAGATSLRELRSQGLPRPVFRAIGEMLGCKTADTALGLLEWAREKIEMQ